MGEVLPRTFDEVAKTRTFELVQTMWSKYKDQKSTMLDQGTRRVAVTIHDGTIESKQKVSNNPAWLQALRGSSPAIIVGPYTTYRLTLRNNPAVGLVKVTSRRKNRDGVVTYESVVTRGVALTHAYITPGEIRSYVGEADLSIVTKALAEAREKEIDMLSELAELPSTLAGIWELLRTLREPMKAIRRFRALPKLEQSKLFPSLWLRIQFEVLPTIGLIEDLLKQLDRKPVRYQTVRKSIESSEEKEPRETVKSPVSLWTCELDIGLRFTVERRDRAWIRLLFDRIGDNKRRFGFDPALTAWELTRLSWLLDYFVKVGEYITAWHGTTAKQEAITVSESVVLRLEKTLLDVRPVLGAEESSEHTIPAVTNVGDLDMYVRYPFKPTILNTPIRTALPDKACQILNMAALAWVSLRKDVLGK